MTIRSLLNGPSTREEYEEAIAVAYAQAEDLEARGESLLAESDEWYDHGMNLERELRNLDHV